MEWTKLKEKRRLDWYLDRELFKKYKDLSEKKGFRSLQKYIKYLLDLQVFFQEKMEENKKSLDVDN